MTGSFGSFFGSAIGRIDERMTPEEVAAAVPVSTYYFCKIFKQSTGMTFTEYVNRQRIEMAKQELLKPDRRITEVAYDVGYQSLSQFKSVYSIFISRIDVYTQSKVTDLSDESQGLVGAISFG